MQRSRTDRATSFAIMTSFIIYASRNEAPLDYIDIGHSHRPIASLLTPSPLVNKLLRLANFSDTLSPAENVTLIYDEEDDLVTTTPDKVEFPLALLTEPSVLIDADKTELILQLLPPSTSFSLPTASQSSQARTELKTVHIEICQLGKPLQPDSDTTDATCSATVFALALNLVASYSNDNFDRNDSLNQDDFLDLVKALAPHEVNYDPSDASSNLAMLISFSSKLHRSYELTSFDSLQPQRHSCMYQPCMLTFAQEYFEVHPSFYSNHIVNPTQFLHAYAVWSLLYYTEHGFTLTFIKDVIDVINDVASYKDFRRCLWPTSRLAQINSRKLRSLHFDPQGRPLPLTLEPIPHDYDE
jgi:hypothetical protein